MLETRKREDAELASTIASWMEHVVPSPGAGDSTEARPTGHPATPLTATEPADTPEKQGMSRPRPEIGHHAATLLTETESAEAADTRPAEERKRPRTGPRETFDECPGCDDLKCVLRWRSSKDFPKDCEAWLVAHHVVEGKGCPDHGPTAKMTRCATSQASGRNLWECQERARTSDNRCRKKSNACQPILTPRSNLTPAQYLDFLSDVANGLATGQAARNQTLNKNTLSLLYDRLMMACVAACNDVAALKFNKLAVDETYVGSKKYGRGRKPRRRGFWFVTVTEMTTSGIGRSVWHLVKRRDRKTLEAVVQQHIVGARSVVCSDSHKGYAKLGEFCRHHCVNHSKEFKSEEGFHTNAAEGAHSVIKRFLLKQHVRYGSGSRQLRKQVALQCIRLADRAKDSTEAWAYRLRELLIVIKNYYRQLDTMDELVTVSSSSAPDVAELEEMMQMDAPQQRLTKKGRPDKRCRSSDSAGRSSKQSSAVIEAAGRSSKQSTAVIEAGGRSSKQTSAVPKKKKLRSEVAKSVRFADNTSVVDPIIIDSSESNTSLVDPAVPQTQANVLVDHGQLFWRKDEHPVHIEECLKMWRQNTGGVIDPEDSHLHVEQIALRYCNTFLESDWTPNPNAPRARDPHEVNNSDVLHSLRPRGCILSMVIELAMTQVVSNHGVGRLFVAVSPQTGWMWMRDRTSNHLDVAAVARAIPSDKTILWPIQYSLHWVLAVIHVNDRIFNVYDSLRGYAHGARTHALDAVSTVIQKVHKRWLAPQLKACVQQESMSNDCGVFTVMNAAKLVRAAGGTVNPDAVSRDWFETQWKNHVAAQAPPPESAAKSTKKPARQRPGPPSGSPPPSATPLVSTNVAGRPRVSVGSETAPAVNPSGKPAALAEPALPAIRRFRAPRRLASPPKTPSVAGSRRSRVSEVEQLRNMLRKK